VNAIILAPGESLTQPQCESVRGQGYVIAVCDAYRLAPWCDAIVANDSAWWGARPDAMASGCRKFSTRRVQGVEQIAANDLVSGGSSSGALAMWVARKLSAERIVMLGFDHRGSHFFGPHTGQLKNTPACRWPIFTGQFKRLSYQLCGDRIEVLNCTPDSALDVFPKATLADGLAWLAQREAA
jgi:hypothetical protein